MVPVSKNSTYRKIHFAVMAIEASAKKANIKRLFRHYDQLHTQSLEWVVDDTLETLHNWEQEERGGKQ